MANTTSTSTSALGCGGWVCACTQTVYLVPHTRWFLFHMAPMRLLAQGPGFVRHCAMFSRVVSPMKHAYKSLTRLFSWLHAPRPCPPVDAYLETPRVVTLSSGGMHGSS
jgi:hypothetical protein